MPTKARMLFEKKKSNPENSTDFPILFKPDGQRAMAYLDSSCQSLRPVQVTKAIQSYYDNSQACSGRSMHRLGTIVTNMVDESRVQVAKFINARRKEEVVFTRNTTEGINLIANTLRLQAGDTVLISDKEHNSNLIPWQKAAKDKGLIYKIIPSLPDNSFNLEGYTQLFDGSVKLVSLTAMSNLDGMANPVQEIIKIAHDKGALVLLDGAQSVPHMQTDVQALDVDFLAFSGHKMCGPSGTGVLYGKYALLEKLDTFMVGGDTVANSTYEDCEFLPPPEKFEAGLQDYAGIIGLGEATRYLEKIGFNKIQQIEHELNAAITEGIQSIPGLHFIGPKDPVLRHGIVSFYIDGLDSHRVALMLDQMAAVMVRSGMHCVHSWFNARKLHGSIRASLYFYNTMEDAEKLITNLIKIQKLLR
ncbi:MAG TPA: aminotransferase class V-fold PLP-dependent enzyme [Anaerolineaceae bacterium]|nr:aminotransferase class V-fold PLP-dependent enzyme [Anaerolineaceae bacterium]